MKYFKNVEAAAIYRVSEKAIRNWIASARQGKLDLELHEHNGKYYIANTTKNHTLITQLAERGQKYKNSRAVITVSPNPEFYNVYSPEQIFDILSNLDVHRAIPLQYTYFESGAHHWNAYTQRLLQEEESNTLTATIKLLENNFSNIDSIIGQPADVNIIDLGIGNALPVRNLLDHFLRNGLLKRYIGIDISEEMLKIASQNINKWFNGSLKLESYLKDINYNHFEHLIAEDAFGKEGKRTANIVLLLGGTLSNMLLPSRVLQLINDGMGKNDIFIHSLKLDSANSRRYFNLDAEKSKHKLNPQLSLVVRLLGIPEDVYEIEQFFSHNDHSRFVQLVFRNDVNLVFEMGGAQRNIYINKGDKVVVWRARHQTALDVIQELDSNGFDLLQASKTQNQEYLLTISKVKG